MDGPTPEIEADDEPESTGPKVEKFKVRFVDDDGNPTQEPVIEEAEGLE